MDAAWLKYLPRFVGERLRGRHLLQAAIGNSGWLFADNVLRLGVGLVVGVWIARYLGPEQFGLISYAIAFVSIFSAVATMGLNGIVVRDLVKEPDTANVTLGSAFLLQLCGGVGAFMLALFAVIYVRPDNPLVKSMVALLGAGMVFKATEVIKYWFESQLNSRYSVWVENGVFLIIAVVKVGLILIRAPVMAFVWAVFAEALLAAMGLLGIYAWRHGKFREWRIQASRAKTLLNDGWPLIFSGLAVMVYMRIDQIMLGQMVGGKAVGIYSAAVRISEVWYFIPTAVVASVFPGIVEAKKQSEELYYRQLQKLYDLMVLFSLSVAIPITFFSGFVIALVFGSAYQQASVVLAINIWSGVFVAIGVAASKWVIIEGYVVNAFVRVVAAAILNVLANLVLIPLYSVDGAAWATLFSYAFANWLSLAFAKHTRKCFVMQSRALFMFGRKVWS